VETFLEFWAYGQPKPKGSMQPGVSKAGKPFARHSGGLKHAAWVHVVQLAANLAMREGHVAVVQEGAIHGQMTFFRPRPNGHLDRRGMVRPRCIALLPSMRPDYDKLCRSVGDALTGVAYKDDSQLTTVLIRKRWAVRAGVYVQLWYDRAPADFSIDLDPTSANEAIAQ
jgi:Holliday junction resolvase RusA-like endonuclease